MEPKKGKVINELLETIDSLGEINKEVCRVNHVQEHRIEELEEQITILTSQRDGFKDQLTEMKRLFDSSQEEVKRLKEENREIRDQILRKRDFYRTRQLNPEKYTYLALGLDDAFKIIQAVTKIKAFHSKE